MKTTLRAVNTFSLLLLYNFVRCTLGPTRVLHTAGRFFRARSVFR